jgi:hypothetical protein
LLTAHFLRHFQQHFHDFAFAQGRLGIEVDSAQGQYSPIRPGAPAAPNSMRECEEPF